MRNQPIILDQFLPDFNAVREAAMRAEFIDWDGHDGQTYKRISVANVPGLQERIEEVMGGPIDMLGMGYRLNYAGEMPNAAIHSDIGWGTHAAVLYLNALPRGVTSGTAFWIHGSTGTIQLDPGDQALLERVEGDWNDETAWRMHQFVKSAVNRCVIYPSKLFHSRYPFEAFGSTPEDGRLIAVAFWSMRNPQ